MRLSILTLCLLAPLNSIAQVMIFPDAESAPEAVGNFYALRAISKAVLNECVAQVPDLKDQISKDFQVWLNADSAYLRKTDQYAKLNPQIGDFDKLAIAEAKKNFQKFSAASDPKMAVQLYCLNHFAALADGRYRKLTPKTYQFVEALPNLKQ